MNDLEAQRQANIQRNKAHLSELGILYKAPGPTTSTRKASTQNPPPTKKRKTNHPLPPSRASARIASAPTRPLYNDDDDDNDENSSHVSTSGRKASKPGSKTKAAGAGRTGKSPSPPSPLPVTKDLSALRASWSSWTPAAPPPTRDDDDDDSGTLHFADQPTFRPNKTPSEMLREGCFGGSYFRPLFSRHLGATVAADDYLDLPGAWIAGLDVARYLTSPTYDADVNKYKVKCGQSIEEWEAAGWIDHRFDVRGWFQWYCRFYMGRRCEDDERQVGRWRKCVGETGRWRRALLKKYRSMGVREVFDDGEDEEKGDVSPVMHQTCFQWGYE